MASSRTGQRPTGKGEEMSSLASGRVAKALGVERRTVTRWAKEGKLEPDPSSIGGHYRFPDHQIAFIRAAIPDIKGTDVRCDRYTFPGEGIESLRAIFEYLEKEGPESFPQYIDRDMKHETGLSQNESEIELSKFQSNLRAISLLWRTLFPMSYRRTIRSVIAEAEPWKPSGKRSRFRPMVNL